MIRCLDKNQVAERLGVKPKTAAAMMMEMHPIPLTGKVRHKWVVTETNLEQWMEKRMLGKPKAGSISTGCKRRLERR